MNSLFDRLNLRPNERRLVIIVAIVVFILLNAFFVWPHFGDWGRLQKRKREATALLKAYQTEVDNTARYQKQLAELQQAGAAVASEEQASKFSTTVNNQAILSGVQVSGSDFGGRQMSTGKTNQFFDEQRAIINVTTEEKPLVDFLYNLGAGGSLIRVRSMSLSTDAQRQHLLGNIQLVASFARKAPPKVAPAAAPARSTPAPAASAHSTNPAGHSSLAAARSNAASRTGAPTKK
jgi:hypothetical protein